MSLRAGTAFAWRQPRGRVVHTAAFLALLAFCFAATSYKIRIQDAAMVFAVAVIIWGALLEHRMIWLGGKPGLWFLAFVAFDRHWGLLDGQIMAFFIIAVAAAEAAVALAMIIALMRLRGAVTVDEMTELSG